MHDPVTILLVVTAVSVFVAGWAVIAAIRAGRARDEAYGETEHTRREAAALFRRKEAEHADHVEQIVKLGSALTEGLVKSIRRRHVRDLEKVANEMFNICTDSGKDTSVVERTLLGGPLPKPQTAAEARRDLSFTSILDDLAAAGLTPTGRGPRLRSIRPIFTSTREGVGGKPATVEDILESLKGFDGPAFIRPSRFSPGSFDFLDPRESLDPRARAGDAADSLADPVERTASGGVAGDGGTETEAEAHASERAERVPEDALGGHYAKTAAADPEATRNQGSGGPTAGSKHDF